MKMEFEAENIEKFYKKYEETIFPFYKDKGIENKLFSNGFFINARSFVNDNPKAKILIVTGYNEAHYKYSELIFDMFQKGYSVYCFDHRGQGQSQKFTHQNGRGYFENFDDFGIDIKNVFDWVKNDGDAKLPVYVIAHSMGGLISTYFIANETFIPDKLVLCAPFFGLNVGPMFLELPLYLMTKLIDVFGFGRSYAFGQVDCIPFLPFETNDLTHSFARFHIWRRAVNDIKDFQLGGPTVHWVNEAFHATRKVRTLGDKIKIPFILLQAENDTVVRNKAQDIFLEKSNVGIKHVLKNSLHEIFMEVDEIRNEALDIITQFLK